MKTGDWILVLADDLTGALEVGAKFAGHGLEIRVTTDLSIATQPPRDDVLIIDTETRHLTGRKAYDVVHTVSKAAARFNPSVVYKKTDSTLRGNIGAELRALQAVFPAHPMVFAPAYPQMGRTVREGKLYVWGKLLHETEFAHDPMNATLESDVKALLKNDEVLVLDAESSSELTEAIRLVAARTPIPLLAGPAAVAAAFAECVLSGVAVRSSLPAISRCLVVNGSLHPVSLEQVMFAQGQGCFDKSWSHFKDFPDTGGMDRAMHVGKRVRGLIERLSFDGLIIFGGDTAFGIHSALGSPPFEPYGEILPGVPLSRSLDLFWITKAGGFGSHDVLHQIQRRLI